MNKALRETSVRPEVESAESSKTGDLMPELTEDLALSLLKQPAQQPEILEKITKNRALMRSRKLKLALVTYPKTPRHLLPPLLRHLFTFDLMRVALTPTIAADIKIAAEESLINRLEKLSLGEKLSLARRASGRVAASLLDEPNRRVINAALQNSRLTETAIIKQLTRRKRNEILVEAICNHPTWKLRPEIISVLKQENTATDAVGRASTGTSLP
ncbi:MAG TPA: hypothetical protein VGN39_13885 [Terriglobales bacterium]|jgi:hypothetical protein|nr:hypothetical protein [Terriglobales bacterium]